MSAVQIPADPEPLSLDLARTAFLVVDMQNAFASPGGMLDLAGIDVAPARDVVANARLVCEAARSAGMRVIGVSDAGGAVYNPGGIDAFALSDHVAEAGTVAGFDAADPIAEIDMWALECELAVPAALAGAIDADVAARLNARVVVEAANGPTLPEADPVLVERGIFVVPDILANAGGVTASYFEWAQSRQGYAWDEETVAARLRSTIDTAFEAVWAKADNLGVSLRRGAFALALDRVAEAIAARGLFP